MYKDNVLYDHPSFVKYAEELMVSEGLHDAVKEFCKQMDEQKAINAVTFSHEDYGNDVLVYIRRDFDGYLVSLEDKEFSMEER